MEIKINKSAKRVLSIALALAMVIGTLFTANVGVNITANAETATIAEGTIDLLDGSDTTLADNGETGADWDNAIIIDSAEEFVYLAKAAGDETAGKYYKVADGLVGFDLSAGDIDLDGTLADNLTKIQAGGKNHSGDKYFQGNFDGNGVTVYGALINGATYAGVFPMTKNTVTIKNLNVKLSYLKATGYAGGIVGYHTADVIAYEKDAAMHSVTIENCTVSETHVEITGTSWGYGVGAIMGRGNAAPSWKESDKGVDGNGDGDTADIIYVNTPYVIKNCYMNFAAAHLVSTAASTNSVTRGGIVGACGSNALAASDCVVIGITPYATNQSATDNGVQHSGLESHFTNIYTDTGSLQTAIGGTLGTRDFTGRIFILTEAEMTGDAAVTNMNLAWFATWTPGAAGEYPTINQTGEASDVSFWSGSAATAFESGTGTKDDPFIIKTADQLYRALSLETDTTEGVASSESASVAGGVQSGTMLKQDSTTDYVAVYTPYYYKVDDSVKAFYLNNVYSNETLDGAKTMGASSNKKTWAPGKSFVGHLDGNGVTIYGMYNTGVGLIYKLDGSAEVKNINFNACYVSGTGNVSLLTTYLGSYTNDTTIINVSNISVRNSYLATSRNITLTARTDTSGCYDHNTGPALVSTAATAENFIMSNCLYDGRSCERAIGSGSEATIDMMGGLYSGYSSANNFVLNGCVSLGAPAANEVYVSGKEVFYNRYDANSGYPVHFYGCYSDIPLNEITTAYPDKYDKLLDIERIAEADEYEMFDMPKLSWSNWALTSVDDDSRVIPMPTVNTADEVKGSYVSIIGSEAKTGIYAGVGPYPNGTNPYTYKLKGSGTEADPYIIETDVQLARAIATGGMNLYDKLYYKLGNDIDISGGSWLTQDDVITSSAAYTYTPFQGYLDGDGHTVTGLSAGDSASAGLIPVLDGGTVKNLHLRDVTVVSGTSAGAIVGEIYDNNWEDEIYPTIENCSVEGATISAADGYYGSYYFVGYDDVDDDTACVIANSYFIGTNGTVYVTDNYTQTTADTIKNEIVNGTTDEWYIGGKEGSLPRLVAQAEKMDCADVDGDGIGSEYTANDLTSLRNNLLKKSAYKYIFGDVSRNGTTNIADLAALQRTLADDYGSVITDSFFANVKAGNIKVYYGENDNYDAARKVELYLEELTGTDITKVVSSSKGTVTGVNSDSTKVYLHAGDSAGTPDGELEIIVGNIDNYSAYATNTVATAANTYAVTYDAEKKVVWLQGANFTAVEQAAINFANGCSVQGDVVYTCASTTLEDYKKPITVKLDTDFDGVTDKDTVLYYAWGDEFEEDTLNTNNWTHNNQQSEGMQGTNSYYSNQEIAPIKDLDKVIVVENGRLSMKRGYDSTDSGLGSSTNGTVALDVTPGEENGYSQWTDDANGANAIDADGSDVYFSSGKLITDRGMLYKQGYIEFQGQLPADGHAFPAWWLMGRPAQSQSNNGYDQSLYSKVYKLNPNYDGVSNAYTADNMNSYKYQIPSAIYEIDMIEVMQHPSRYGAIKESTGIFGDGNSSSYHNATTTNNWTQAVGWYQINSTIHKWWNNGAQGTDVLYIHDWDNNQLLGGITNDDFSTTSTAGSWIHNIGSTSLDFGTSVSSSGNFLTGYDYYDGSIVTSARDDLQATRKYGFSWNTNGVDGFEATLYVYNTDGSLWKTVPIASGMSDYSAFKDGNKKTEANGALGSNAAVYSDAKVFNQYMYILFDNKYYSSNNKSGTSLQFTDLLTSAGLTSLEIDYVRIYQEDGARDIVTKETEAFNNANHFGY